MNTSFRQAPCRPWLAALTSLCLTLTAPPTLAQGATFEVAASPSRLELSANPGQRVGQSLRIFNVGNQVTSLSFRTMDWSLSEQGDLKFHDELLPGSCRPWVALERRTRQLGAKASEPYRFQVSVPADAPRGECRFMIAIEGVDPAQVAAINSGGASLNLPISGRIAITVYVAIGGARPKLELIGIGASSVRNERRPVITVRNTGDAHGRLDGSLTGRDADGKTIEFVPEGQPVLPGQTRTLALNINASGGAAAAAIKYPLKLNGTIDWDDGAFQVEASLP